MHQRELLPSQKRVLLTPSLPEAPGPPDVTNIRNGDSFDHQSTPSSMQFVTGKKTLAQAQFPWKNLLPNATPLREPPTVTRPPSTAPSPLQQVVLPEPDLLLLDPLEKLEATKRILIHQALSTSYDRLSLPDFLYLSRWVAAQLSTTNLPLCRADIIRTAYNCPLDASVRPRIPFRGPLAAAPAPQVSTTPTLNRIGAHPRWDKSGFSPLLSPQWDKDHKALMFHGLGGTWRALDCGDFVVLGSGVYRRNSCVYLAVSKALALQADNLILQVRQSAQQFFGKLPHPMPPRIPAAVELILHHYHDLFSPDHPVDPISLALWAPPCLRKSHLLLLQCEHPSRPCHVVLVSDTLPTHPQFGQARLGCIFLFQGHAWVLPPPAHLSSPSSFSSWYHHLSLHQVPFTHLPWSGWHPAIELFHSPITCVVPWPPVTACSTCSGPLWLLGGVKFIGAQVRLDSTQPVGRTYGNKVKKEEKSEPEQVYKWSRNLGEVAQILRGVQEDKTPLRGDSDKIVEALRTGPPKHYDQDKRRAFWIGLHGQLVEIKPAYSIETWHLATKICEGIIRESDFSIPDAIEALRSFTHSGRVVMERNAASVKNLLTRNVIPGELSRLVWDRMVQGVPYMFGDDPPRRQGRDKMHKSAEEHVEEVLKLVWEEVVQGKSLIISASFREAHHPDLPNSPLARIPKFDAKGKERPTGRVIRNHSYPKGESINDKAANHTAEWEILLPTIHHIIQTVLYYKQQVPGVPIVICKRDVSAAFEWCGLAEGLVPYMGSFVTDVNKAGFGDTFVFPMRATFGYVHSPSEWAINGNAIDVLNRASVPAEERRDGQWSLDVHGYVDDYMIITPDVGLRRWIVTQAVEEHMTGILGEQAVNVKKNMEEGGYDTQGILLGFLVDTEEETISLSAEKLERARAYLNDPIFDWGNTKITIHDLQKLLGRLYHWSVACRPAQAFIAGCLRMLSKGSGLFITPGFDEDSIRMGWERFWADIAWLRIIFKKDLLTSVPLTAPFLTLQHPVIRYAQAKENDRFYLIGTDATEWSGGAVNFTLQEGIRIQLPGSVSKAIQSMIHRDKKNSPHSRVGEFISMAITELLAVITALLHWYDHIQGGLVVIVIDNSNALHWIRSRGAKNLYAQALLRIISRLEIRGQFVVWAEEVRSVENEIPDSISRLYTRDQELDHEETSRLETLWEKMFNTIPGILHLPEDFLPPIWFQHLDPHEWDMRLPGETAEDVPQLQLYRPSKGKVHGSLSKTVRFAEAPIFTTSHKYGMMLAGYQDFDRAVWYQELNEAVELIDTHVLAARTKDKYERDFKMWKWFRERSGEPVFLQDSDKQATELALRQYVGYLGIIKGLKHTTIVGYLSAVRHYHLGQGCPDPTASSRVRSLLKGLKRLQGAITMKRPVTPEMLRYIKSCIDLSVIKELYLWGALIMGFSFLLRASEYVGDSEDSYDNVKVIRRKDITFRMEGKATKDPEKAEEIEVCIRASKTDQYGEGVHRVLTRTGGELCVVSALMTIFKATTSIMNDAAPLFQLPSGGMICRSTISDILKKAARDLGHSETGISSHSLRGGGATALYAANYSVEEICFFGRWTSDSWMRYVKMTRGRLASVAEDLEVVEVQLYQSRSPSGAKKPPRFTSRRPQPGARWFDQEDTQTYVVVDTRYEPSCRKMVTYYATSRDWSDANPEGLVLGADQLYNRLEANHKLLYSLPAEVNGWISQSNLKR